MNHFFPWNYCSEKSSSTKRNERIANDKFNTVKHQVETVLAEMSKVTIKLGCLPESESPLAQLPSILFSHICSYAGLPEPVTRPKPMSMPVVQTKMTSRSGRVIKKVDYSELAIDSLGSKIAIPLLKPNVHLTAPCWRDFARAVRKNERWNVKRIVATPVEKQKFKESRKSNVYFINLVFTVPARPKVECLDNVK
ncbi:hypothetical protein ACHAWO_005959 [Cyclotella atomus]|uniref:Uncharacterized protein n=1 Tax=Cyclotella atomus TaxID=382360 RepID=A0ABD3NUG6_9STRA